MLRVVSLLAIAALLLVAPAQGDELIQEANNQQALFLGIARMRMDEQALPSGGSLISNEEAGPQLQIGYSATRPRTVFGFPDLYTNLEVLLSGSDMSYAGNSFDPNTETAGLNSKRFNVATEAVRLRVGRSYEYGADGRVALTPYLGMGQQAWLRNATIYASFSAYNHLSAEIGLLAQARLSNTLVLGADVSLGRTLGALEAGGYELVWPHAALTSGFALYLDNRTYSDWHQRIQIRQDLARYGGPAYSGGTFEPRRNSTLAIELQMGTELDLFHALFY